MSALGQKRTHAVQQRISALPPIADICSATRDVRFGPIADMRRLNQTLRRRGEQWLRAWSSRRCGSPVVRLTPLLRHIAVMGHAGIGIFPWVGGSRTQTLALRQNGPRLSRIDWLAIGANIVAGRVILF